MSVIDPGAVPVLQNALDYIHAHPEEWSQGNWKLYRNEFDQYISYSFEYESCGTACCLAGWITELHPDIQRTPEASRVVYKGDNLSVENAALQVLTGGYDWWNDGPDSRVSEVSRMFVASNSEARLWELAGTLTDGAIQPPADLE